MRNVVSITIAFILWFIMFSPLTKEHVDFWYTMCASAVILITLSFLIRKNWRIDFKFNFRYLFLGLISSVVLWWIFYFGDLLSSLLFNFAKSQITSIYSIKAEANSTYISIALAFLIGPAEEIFWRGLIQNNLSKKFNKNIGFLLATTMYTMVHVASLNFMLIMASLICGLFWGFLYRRHKNLWMLIISHSIWDCAVFIWFPIN